MLMPDTSDVGPIDGGTYKATVLSAIAGVSKTGGQKLVVDFGVDVGGKTRKRTSHMPVTGSGAFGFNALLRACHFDEAANKIQDKNIAPVDKAFDEAQLVGQNLMLVIEPDIYNGQPTDKITGYLRA